MLITHGFHATRSTFRTGGPQVPKPAKDFYNRLFWYGFDPDDTEEVGDKTVFGGTKGKFNGLSYLSASESGSNSRLLPQSKRDYDDYYDDEYDDDDDEYDDDDVSAEDDAYYTTSSRSMSRSMKPPNDSPLPRSERIDPVDRRAARRQRRRSGQYYDDDDFDDDSGNDWVSKRVSSWFSNEEEDADGDYSDRGRRRQKRQTSSSWSPTNILDTFFGVDRDEMEYKRNIYNENMGIGPSRKRRKSSRSRESPRRAGYAYRYVDDDESPPVADMDTTFDVTAHDEPSQNDSPRSIKPTATKEEEPPAPQRRERTWEERALSVEQVPPADVVAWGPSGELQMDARTKGIIDALEDIQLAEQKLKAKEKKESLAREDISILKV